MVVKHTHAAVQGRDTCDAAMIQSELASANGKWLQLSDSAVGVARLHREIRSAF